MPVEGKFDKKEQRSQTRLIRERHPTRSQSTLRSDSRLICKLKEGVSVKCSHLLHQRLLGFSGGYTNNTEMWLLLITLLSYVTVLCYGANIVAFPVSNSYSHFTVMEPLLKELASRGHRITVVSSFPQKHPVQNYNDIDIGHLLLPVQNNFTFDRVFGMGKDPFSNMQEIWDAGNMMCEKVLGSGVLHPLYNSSVPFDLVITHVFAYECFAAFAHKFNSPIISIVTSSALPWSNPRVGNPEHPAYVVNNYIDAHEDMTLYQRVVNSMAWFWASAAIHPFCYRHTDDIVHRYLDPSAPSVVENLKRTSLVMVNSHFSILQSRPLVPNFIEIGGIHVKDAKPLPKDLKEFLDGAADGVIVFSLGSLVRASSMSNSSLRALMDGFAALPRMRVVFKFEEEVHATPPNVLVRKWLPQRDLLAHPNVRVLMAHGGQSSTIEAVYTGTPMVGMPLFSDQYNNIQSLVLRGAAVLLDFRLLTKQRVLNALTTVLSDPRYKLNAERLSKEFRDRPERPLQTAVFWTEYVLRHDGAPQLRSRSADLPWYRFLLLDVAAVVLPIIALVVVLLSILLKLAFNRLFRVFLLSKKPKDD